MKTSRIIPWMCTALLLLFFASMYILDCIYLPNYRLQAQADRSHSGSIWLHWNSAPIPVVYKIHVYRHFPDDTSKTTDNTLMETWTLRDHWLVTNEVPSSAFVQISALTVLGTNSGKTSNVTPLEDLNAVYQALPSPRNLTPYQKDSPSSSCPVLQWTLVEGAVCYELQLFNKNAQASLPDSFLWTTRKIFTVGTQLDLKKFRGSHFYWRVRALDYDGHPISVFSGLQNLYINRKLPPPNSPVIPIHAQDQPVPFLYPVYSWIPMLYAESYQVELLNAPPENPNGLLPSKHQIWSTMSSLPDCYDEHPRFTDQTLYWRVRGLDGQGNAVGVFSDAVPLKQDWSRGHYAATYGDSISHGGGGISYSPTQSEYNYQTYLNFPVVNLSYSGDTSETMVARFDSDVLPVKPQFLIIMGGTNSLRAGTPPEEVIDDLKILQDKCLKNGIRPIFLTLPPINPEFIQRAFDETTDPNWKHSFAEVNQFIRQQPYFVDLAPHFTDSNGELPAEYAVDGIHLDANGKRIMGELINAAWPQLSK